MQACAPARQPQPSGRALHVRVSGDAPSPSTRPHARDCRGGSARARVQSRCPPYPRRLGGLGLSARGFLEYPPASQRDPGPHWLVESRASSPLGSGFPGTHPVPTPESWRPARDARRPGGRLAKFRVPLQETRSCVPGSGKPVV